MIGIEFVCENETIDIDEFIRVEGTLNKSVENGFDILNLVDCTIFTDVPIGSKYVE